MEQLKIINEVMPVITVNFEQVQKSLSEMMEKYKNIVVTDTTLSSCKTTQKDLAGLKIKIDEYRLERKKALSEPIVAFENQMKSLIALVDEVQAPIKEGIKVYDDQTRATNRMIAVNIATDMVAKYGLRDKYAEKINVTDKHCQLSTTKKDILDDMNRQAMELLVTQNMEDEQIETIKDAVNMENEKLLSKMDYDRFLKMLDKGMGFRGVLEEVRKSGDDIYTAEHPTPKTIVVEEVDYNEPPMPTFKPRVQNNIPLETEAVFGFKSEPEILNGIFRVKAEPHELDEIEEFIATLGVTYTFSVTD